MSDWTTPHRCRRCRYPVALGYAVCPSCGRSAEMFSSHNRKRWLDGIRRRLILLAEVCFLLALAALALTLQQKLSPLLLLLPIFLIFAPPPASRGGRTRVRGKKRRSL